jgi:epoxide hydrolase-like predicted phosphatase
MERKPMKVKAVISDLGGVIVDFDNITYINQLAALAGKPQAAVEDAMEPSLVEALHKGRITGQDFFQQVRKTLDLKLSYREFCQIYAGIFTLNPNTEALLQELKGKVGLHLLSNTNEIHWDHEKARHPVLRSFDTYTLSHEEGVMKPSKKIYEAAVTRTGLAPEQCVFIDDLEEFTEGAKACGLQAIQFQSAQQVRDELVAMEVLNV